MQYKFLSLIFLLGCTEKHPVITQDNTLASIPINRSSTVVSTPYCPSDMVEIEGDYCPNVEQICLKWLDPDNRGVNGSVMCGEFQYPTKCLSDQLEHKHYCIDKYEFPNKYGELPKVQMTYFDAESELNALGKRICTESEHTFACEGPNMQPYPYGDGYHRDSSVCNIDQKWIDPFIYDDAGTQVGQKPLAVVDQRLPSGYMSRCVSTFGVYDIVGNADEWAYNPKGYKDHAPWYSVFKGGHFCKGARNRCRPLTNAHGPTFSMYQTGTRGCK